MANKTIGSGDFSIGSEVWPGTSKLIEETGELQQVLGKLIAVHGDTKHWDGDLRHRLVEELGDAQAAIQFFVGRNLTNDEAAAVQARTDQKWDLFEKWHASPESVRWRYATYEGPRRGACANCAKLGKYCGGRL